MMGLVSRDALASDGKKNERSVLRSPTTRLWTLEDHMKNSAWITTLLTENNLRASSGWRSKRQQDNDLVMSF